MEGLSISIQRSNLPIAIEMDSSEAVAMITCAGQDRSVYASLINVIRYLLSLRSTCITHVPRVQNKASDCLAAFGRREGRTLTWIQSGPSEVLEIVKDDCKDLIFE